MFKFLLILLHGVLLMEQNEMMRYWVLKKIYNGFSKEYQPKLILKGEGDKTYEELKKLYPDKTKYVIIIG